MYQISKLKSGINLIKVPLKGTRSVTVLALFPIGSRYETREISGAAHFLEHMLFKGTAKRPNAADISRTLDALGADYNAFTSKDHTGYYVKIAAEKQEVAYDILSDIIYHSTLVHEELEKEKGAIVEELRMYKDNPTMAIDMLLDTALFKDTQLGWDIGGTPETVRGMSREKLLEFYNSHYSPKNMTLVVAGAFSKKWEKILEKYFNDKKPNGKTYGLSYYKNSYDQFNWPKKVLSLEERVEVEEKKLDQAHLMIGFPGLANDSPDRYAASILINILGVGMSSRLFVEVREKRGLSYMIRAGSTSYRDVGVNHIQAGLDPSRLFEALQVIKAEVVRIANEPVTKEELESAKSNLAGRLALSLEDSSTQAEWYGRQFIFNKKIEKPEDVIMKLQKVTRQDVLRLAKKLFNMDEMRLSLIGPLPKGEVIDMVKKI